MGDNAVDVNVSHDHTPTGTILTVLHLCGLHSQPLGATERAALVSASSGSDSTLRAALVSNLGAGFGRAWDTAPALDDAHSSYVSGYVAIRTRLRSCLGALP